MGSFQLPHYLLGTKVRNRSATQETPSSVQPLMTWTRGMVEEMGTGPKRENRVTDEGWVNKESTEHCVKSDYLFCYCLLQFSHAFLL
jgi:hypothetical protein